MHGEVDRVILAGTGHCCKGYLVEILDRTRKTDALRLSKADFSDEAISAEEKEHINHSSHSIGSIFSLDFVVEDVMPVEWRRNGFNNRGERIGKGYNTRGYLVTGNGCAGAGVRLIDEATSKIVNVVGSDEFYELTEHEFFDKRFEAYTDCGISLYLRGGEFRDRLRGIDLTSRLEDLGVDVDGSIGLNLEYDRRPIKDITRAEVKK